MALGPEFWHSIFLHFENSLWFLVTKNAGSRFFRTVFVKILRPPLLALVPEAGLRISGSAIKGSPQTFTWLLATGNLTVVEERFPANCFLHGLEIFVAEAVMTGIACVVQCYNSKSNYWAGISLHQNLASGPAIEKRIKMKMVDNVRSHTQCKFQPERYFCRLFWSLHASQRSTFHCPLQLGKKIPEKILAARRRRKVRNLNAVEVIVCFFFTAPPIVQNLFSFNIF